MLSSLLTCMSLAAVAAPPSGPKAMPENVAKPERYDHLTTEPRRSTERPQGLLQYDLDSAYLPDVVGGYVEVIAGSGTSTMAAESQEVLREVATLLKERAEIGVWVTAEVETDSAVEMRDTVLAVQSVIETLKDLGIENVPYRIWRKDERRPEQPLDVLEIRVTSSDTRPIT
jgi:hypothetical protein